MIVTESIFSNGWRRRAAVPKSPRSRKYGAWLMVDEAHATGLYGKNRRGLAEELGVSDRIESRWARLARRWAQAAGSFVGLAR